MYFNMYCTWTFSNEEASLTLPVPCERNLMNDLEKYVKHFQILQAYQKWKEKSNYSMLWRGGMLKHQYLQQLLQRILSQLSTELVFSYCRNISKEFILTIWCLFLIWETRHRRPWHFYHFYKSHSYLKSYLPIDTVIWHCLK